MTEDRARKIASDIVDHLMEVGIVSELHEMWAYDKITERILININTLQNNA